MKKLFAMLTASLFVLLFTVFVSADVIVGPAVVLIMAIRYWPVVLLVTALIVVTVILIRKLKK